MADLFAATTQHIERRETFMSKSITSHRLGGIIAALVVLATAALVVPGAAVAGHCDAGDFCAWGDTNYSGDHLANPGDDEVWPCGVFCSPDVDENDDSVKNRDSVRVRVYDDDHFGGGLMYCADSGEWETDIADDRDNDGSSHNGSAGTSCPAGEPHP